MSIVDPWIGAQIGPNPGRRSLLILASSRALAARIRRYLADSGGRFEVEVSTPRALIHQMATQALAPPAASAPEALASQFVGRPGLFALAQGHLEAAAAAHLAGADLSALPPDWQEAARAGVGSEFERGLSRLLAGRRAGAGLHLAGGISFQRVVAIGFAGAAPPWVERVLARVGAARPDLPLADDRIAWEAAADPTAEARAAASRLLGGDPDDALVLVQDRTTALRVRDALARNGIPCGWSDAGTLAAHPLAAAARQAARWLMSGPDPLLRAGEIEHWVGRAGLGRHLSAEREALCAGAGGAGWFSRRSVIAALERTRLLEAPLSLWIARLAALPVQPTEDTWTRPTAIRLAALLSLLEAPGETPGSIGAVRRVLLDAGVRFHDDPIARAILGAMRDGADAPADAIGIDDLLARPQDDHTLRSGVEILTYEEYDGRPAARLVLLDLHDKGIARRSSPDPLLDEASLDAIGLRTGLPAIRERFRQLRRACAQAERVFGVVARTDSSGRPVVAPGELPLAAEPTDPSPAALPEFARWNVLHLRTGTADGDASADLAAHLARQASLEWVRAGRAVAPSAWGSWCGAAGEAGNLSLAVPWSVTRLFRPLAHCPWQAFASVILQVKDRQAVSEELDPAEVGTAVHRALERAGPLLEWRPEREGIAAARQAAVSLLSEETERAFAEAGATVDGLSPARSAAVTGGGKRWAGHWKTWVVARIRDAPGAPMVLAEEALPLQPAWRQAVGQLTALLPLEGATTETSRAKAILRLAKAKARGDRPTTGDVLGQQTEHPLADDCLPALRQLWADPVMDLLAGALLDLEQRASVLLDPLTSVHAEVRIEDVEVTLGTVKVRVSGQVDRVDRVGRWLRIVDYKSGGMPPRQVELADRLTTGAEPQLLVYALALEAMTADATVASLGWDFLRDTMRWDKLEPRPQITTDKHLVGAALLADAATELGRRVADAVGGTWPLEPNEKTCPMLGAWGHDHCAFAGACRLRGLPA